MAGRRDQITMTSGEIEAFLEAERTLQVASINGDGTPHLVAMWYGRHGGELAFWTYAKSQKVVNLRRDPRLTVMVETGTKYEELKGVTIYGRARIIEDARRGVRVRRRRVRALLGPDRQRGRCAKACAPWAASVS